VYQQQQQEQQQQQQQQEQDAENTFLDPPFSRIKMSSFKVFIGLYCLLNPMDVCNLTHPRM
jgi:hypothetical protein